MCCFLNSYRAKVLELAEQLDALTPNDRARLIDREMAARVRLSHVIDPTDDTMVRTLGALFGHLQVRLLSLLPRPFFLKRT
jgi:hypothetical protein